MQEVRPSIERLKRELDGLRHGGKALLPPDLQHAYDIELTYASNAIEGNTLTLGETAEIIQHGITVGGKRISEHLEAIDHYAAVQWMREVASKETPLGEDTVAELHRRVVLQSRKDIAGVYSRNARRVAGSPVIFPNPAKIPMLMEEFGQELRHIDNTPRSAFDTHYRLVTIHPFDDGNGRTARLLMNLILLRGGYAPVSVGPADRREYLTALESAQLAQDSARFQAFMHRKLLASMEMHVRDLREGREAETTTSTDPEISEGRASES